ncbi:MAG TPA: hypothetical protein VMN76_08215 [Acidobacteriota bacterium]|nr:hypothetical protein [Acidobacteriota bacterium]
MTALFTVGWISGQTPDRSGRWLIETQSGGGTWVPLILLEMAAESEGAYQGRVLSSSAPFAFSVESIVVSGTRLEIQIGAGEEILVIAGEFEGDRLQGSAGGMGLRNRPIRGRLLNQQQAETPTAPEPEEYNAFRMATMSPDPGGQLALLEAFVERYPHSSLLPRVYLQTVLQKAEMGAPAGEIREAVETAAEAASNPAETKKQIALMLAEADRLDLAEEIVREALSEVEDGSRIHAELLDALGWTLFRKGRTADAREILEEAFRLAPDAALTAMRLGAVLEQEGEDERAELLYADAYAASGHEAARERLEALYLRRRGSLDGLHERIDEIYLQRKPLFETGAYSGPVPTTPLLAELFSSSECLPCQAADYAFDGLMQYFPAAAVTVLSYHLHIPVPAPLASPAAQARASLYGVSSTPYAVFGGIEHFRGGGARQRAEALYQDYRRLIESILEREVLHVGLELEGSLAGGRVTGAVRLQSEEAEIDLDQVRVFVALVEKTAHFTGRNGVHFHHHLVRKFAAEPTAREASGAPYAFSIDLDAAEAELGQYMKDFQERTGLQVPEILNRLNRKELGLVAFAQNLTSGDVLAVASSDLSE